MVLQDLLIKNWFLLGIIFSIVAAEVYPHLGRTGGLLAPEWTAKFFAVIVIFLISGLSISANDFTTAAKKYKIHVFVQFFTFIFIPFVIFGLNVLLGHLFRVNEWILKGLIVVGCMPPPVSSAIILTKAVGGNEAVAVFNSVLGSFLGIVITPLLIWVFLGSSAFVSVISTYFTLIATVIFPLLIGLSLRHFKFVENTHKLPLTGIGQSLLLFIIYTSFCDAFLAYDSPMSASDILVSIILVVLFKIGLLYTCFHFSLQLRKFTATDIAAITFCSTHKSLTLGMPILTILFSGYSHFSQITLPLLIYHPTQIILGGIMIPPFKKWVLNQKHNKDPAITNYQPTNNFVGLIKKMLPVILRLARAYAPYITLPVAALVGVIGYNLESILSDKYTPYQDSIDKRRKERLLEGDSASEGSLKEKKFVPQSIFEKNLSPSLQEASR